MFANITLGKKPQQKGAAKIIAQTTRTEESTPIRRVAVKPTVKRPTKPANKTVAKVADVTAAKTGSKLPTKVMAKVSGKAVAQPANKPAKDQIAEKKIKPVKNAKATKIKMVRDSFTMPEFEYELIAAVKKRYVAKGFAVRKSEVLRAAIIGFAALSDSSAIAALRALPIIKTGRPAKGQK